MTASSIAQYLEQRRTARPAERGDPRRDAWAALASRSVAQEDSSTPAFRPLPFKAASPSDAAGFPPLRQGSALFRPREAPPEPPVDIEERLAEAYHRGVQEGIDAARAEAATARAMERADIQKRAVVERVDFQMNEYAKLAEAIGQGLKDIERRIANSVEQILRPFLYATLASRAVDELVSNIQKLASAGSAAADADQRPRAAVEAAQGAASSVRGRGRIRRRRRSRNQGRGRRDHHRHGIRPMARMAQFGQRAGLRHE